MYSIPVGGGACIQYLLLITINCSVGNNSNNRAASYYTVVEIRSAHLTPSLYEFALPCMPYCFSNTLVEVGTRSVLGQDASQ
jgi:hypothetical protein